jgi:hypothetical protein
MMIADEVLYNTLLDLNNIIFILEQLLKKNDIKSASIEFLRLKTEKKLKFEEKRKKKFTTNCEWFIYHLR